MDATQFEDDAVITFKVKGEHVKPTELARRRAAKKRGFAEPDEAAALESAACAPETPRPPSVMKKPGSALRDRTNIATDSKTTVKARKTLTTEAAPVDEQAPAGKRRRLVSRS